MNQILENITGMKEWSDQVIAADFLNGIKTGIASFYTCWGAVINLLNLIEIASPSGICLIIRLPFLGGGSGSGFDVQSIINAVQAVGGRVEFAQQ